MQTRISNFSWPWLGRDEDGPCCFGNLVVVSLNTYAKLSFFSHDLYFLLLT